MVGMKMEIVALEQMGAGRYCEIWGEGFLLVDFPSRLYIVECERHEV